MVFVTVALLTLVATVALIGVEAYGAYQSHQDANETISAMDSVNEGLENLSKDLQSFVDEVVKAVESLADAIYDAIMAVMQYMDAWGSVVVLLFAVVIVILLAMFWNVAKLRRSRR